MSAGSKWSRWRCDTYRKSALPKRSHSSARLSGNGNQEPKNVGPITGSYRMLPPAVSMNIPAWPRPVMRMDSSRVEQLSSLRGEFRTDRASRRGNRYSVLEQRADVVGFQCLAEQSVVVAH